MLPGAVNPFIQTEQFLILLYFPITHLLKQRIKRGIIIYRTNRYTLEFIEILLSIGKQALVVETYTFKEFCIQGIFFGVKSTEIDFAHNG